ncbi:MAG: RrF2 family transcriptional regulator [Planctomycetota bacterium]|jgi:DNA-binding IscR family transcriptional regulator
MDLIRRDTDYAFRFVAHLSGVFEDGRTVSARSLAKDNQVTYALTCKILQKLAGADIVESVMGPKGGFRLSKKPQDIRRSSKRSRGR